uniref:Uncharacterized protein n=1 Tax=Anguilla anguilla TaxID=7936 RepID=A0A0E9VE38_ANGAN
MMCNAETSVSRVVWAASRIEPRGNIVTRLMLKCWPIRGRLQRKCTGNVGLSTYVEVK